MIKNGFTLIELIIVMLIMGVLLTVAMPRFRKFGPTSREQFVSNLNALTQEAARAAQFLSKVQKVLFDFTSHKIELWDIDGKKLKKFTRIPDEVEVKDFFINQKSQFGQGLKKYTAYFLIDSHGITQDVKIFFVDHSQNVRGPSLGSNEVILNPITAKFNSV